MTEQSSSDAESADGFELFACLWAVAGVFHLLDLYDWRWWSLYGPFLGIATLGVLARPTWPVFACLVLVDFACIGRNFFFLPNHLLFSWVVNCRAHLLRKAE